MYSKAFVPTGVIHAAIILALLAPAAMATSALYVTGFDTAFSNVGKIDVLNTLSNNLVNSWLTQNSNEQAIAIDSTVRTLGQQLNQFGSEYMFNGTFTGTSYQNTATNGFTDGTQDATHHYAVTANGGVYSFDLSWLSPSLLFTLSPIIGSGATWTGITYDASNNSLWFADFNNSEIGDFTLGGTLLSSFSTFPPSGTAPQGLALNTDDQTLWIGTGTDGRFDQYSKLGAHLQTQTYSGLSTVQTLGMEFGPLVAPVPEPAGFAIAGLSLAAIFAGVRFRRRA